uniref:Odorant receptor n=1 Tax=Campoletis chlorideae TaxID=219166 RepID=A0A346D407_9HYME|nr:odorant receptor [Campoletis chlorideae]
MEKDIFSTRNYRLNQIFMRILGVWPEQSLAARILLPSFFVFMNLSLYIPELRQLNNIRGDIDRTMEILTSCTVMSGSTIMVINTAVKSTEIFQLIKWVRRDWESLANNPQLIAVLDKYAAEGRQKTIIHAVMMYGGGTAFFCLPLTPMVLNVVLPLNESRPKKFMYGTDYGVDGLEYYYWILFHSCIVTYTCMAVFAGIDSVFAVWVQHCCALFEVAGYYLKRGVEKLDVPPCDKETIRAGEDEAFTNLRFCIQQHQAAIHFADLIESAYTMVTALVLGMSMILMSMSGVLFVIQIHNTDEALRYVTVVSCVLYHLYHHTVSGQDLINHSSQISEYAYECDWYDFPPKAQKLLVFIIARAQRPCFLTAGKVYEINMHNFSEVVKTSISYFTMFSSLRE